MLVYTLSVHFDEKLDVTILLPCLNESETIANAISKAMIFLESSNFTGEILVADNGSIDGSQVIAKESGARVIDVPIKGYGAALQAGIKASNSTWVVMGDSDSSYALDKLELFISSLESGYDLVIGNRFKGGIHPGAMPWLHKYLGNPLLSFLGRKFFKVPIYDFHCGLRAFNLVSISKLNLRTTGMEFASEMIIKAALHNLKICEVPTTLSPDGRSRKPHLRTWSDGWRHLVFILLASPKWLFFYPGLVLTLLSVFGIGVLLTGPRNFQNLEFSINSFLFLIGGALIGTQVITFGILAKIFIVKEMLLPKSFLFLRFEKYFSLGKALLLGAILFILSVIGVITLLNDWTGKNFTSFDLNSSIRITGLVLLALCLSVQVMFNSFFVELLRNK